MGEEREKRSEIEGLLIVDSMYGNRKLIILILGGLRKQWESVSDTVSGLQGGILK